MYIAHIVNTTHTLQLIKEHQIEKRKSKHSFQFCSTIPILKKVLENSFPIKANVLQVCKVNIF